MAIWRAGTWGNIMPCSYILHIILTTQTIIYKWNSVFLFVKDENETNQQHTLILHTLSGVSLSLSLIQWKHSHICPPVRLTIAAHRILWIFDSFRFQISDFSVKQELKQQRTLNYPDVRQQQQRPKQQPDILYFVYAWVCVTHNCSFNLPLFFSPSYSLFSFYYFFMKYSSVSFVFSFCFFAFSIFFFVSFRFLPLLSVVSMS